MNHIGLFEGLGGFSLASEWMGWETIAWCEWNPFCQKVLKNNFPKSEQHGDITKTDFTIYRGKCDILTGGFPCQPYSVSGKRLGKEDERHLWPEMLRAVREIRPRWIVGENVYGIINWNGGMVFDEVQADLEAEGYKIIPVVLPACSIGADTRRERVWFIAYSDKGGSMALQYATEERCKREPFQGFTPIFEKRDGNYVLHSHSRDINGIPGELDSIGAFGNSIVPALALQIFKAIELMEAKYKAGSLIGA